MHADDSAGFLCKCPLHIAHIACEIVVLCIWQGGIYFGALDTVWSQGIWPEICWLKNLKYFLLTIVSSLSLK